MKAISPSIVSEITVSYNQTSEVFLSPSLRTGSQVYQYLLCGFEQDIMALQEQFVVLYLNQANKVLGVYKASTGGLTGTVADIRIILSVALKILATSMIVAHNHPSGSLIPSSADIDITTRLKTAGKLMDIKLLDHLIVSPDGTFYSMCDDGLL